MSRKQRMSFRDAMDLVPDDLPDGAFFAMAHEMAGLEYGEGFDEIAPPSRKQRKDRVVNRGEPVSHAPLSWGGQKHKPFVCNECKRRFRLDSAARQHWRDTHSEARP